MGGSFWLAVADHRNLPRSSDLAVFFAAGAGGD